MIAHSDVTRADDRAVERLVMAALLALLVLNTADVLLTRTVVARAGAHAEANPAARFLLAGYRVEVVKTMILGGLFWRTVTKPRQSLAWLAAVWCVVGVYAMTVAVNYLAWRQHG